MQTILVDARYFDEICLAWGNEYNILPSYVCKSLPEPVCAHPDMTIFDAGCGVYVCAPESYDYYDRLFSGMGIKLLCGTSTLGCNYPTDIAYNVARVGKTLLGHKRSVDPLILKLAKEEGLSFFPSPQGYSKCSSCIISENALITQDPSIARSAIDAKLNVLKIRPGHILLPGYDTGFIGGASGLDGCGKLLFFGDITLHPDFPLIRDFLLKHKVRFSYLKNRPLTDIGTILSISR